MAVDADKLGKKEHVQLAPRPAKKLAGQALGVLGGGSAIAGLGDWYYGESWKSPEIPGEGFARDVFRDILTLIC